MNKYTVYGDKLEVYELEVEANTMEEAYDKADSSESHLWTKLESDNVIRPYQVELINSNPVELDNSDI